MKKLCLLLFVILGTSPAWAVHKPRSLATDSRIKEVSYQEDNVVPLHGTTFITTQIVFDEDEAIVDVEGGDASAWTININKQLPNILNVKPTITNSNSDLLLTTIDSDNKRRYYRFHLMSHDNAKGHETYAIRFNYPEKKRAALLSQLKLKKLAQKSALSVSRNPRDYNWDYSFNGSKAVMPLHVFDDGKFTYLQLRRHQEAPTVFAVRNAKGEEEVVNYRSDGAYIIVQDLAPQFTLRSGKQQVASIFNNREIAHDR